MSRTGETRKPCPRCGVVETRRADRCCGACERVFVAGEVAMKREADLERKRAVAWVGVPRYWPAVYDAGLDTATYDALTKAMRAVATCVAERSLVTDRWMKGYPTSKPLLCEKIAKKRSTGTEWEPWSMPLALAEAIDALDKVVREACGTAYKAGLARGGNALYALAEGRLTTEAFEKETKEASR
jgi:hypothetical protein